MLSIKPIGSTGTEVNYYATLGGEDDCYVNEVEPAGEWRGDGAKLIGLSGSVDAEVFRNLLRGMSPDGKDKLVQNAGRKDRRSGHDLTLSVPKSVSIAWSQAAPELRDQIESACKSAVARTLEEFETMCGVTRRGKAGERIEKAGLIFSVFQHHTARGIPGELPDPNLHWHAVLLNCVVRDDGTTGAFDARPLFRRGMKMTIGALFRAELASELSKLGLECHRPTKKRGGKVSWFELKAVPEALIREMSKRRRQIEKWLRERGVSGAIAAEKAALSTRTKKERFSVLDLLESWQKLDQRFQFGATQIEAARSFRPEANLEERAKQSVTSAIKRLTDQQARFSELEILRFAAEEAQESQVGIAALTNAVRNVLVSRDVVQLLDENDERNFTTEEMLSLEKSMLNVASRLEKQDSHQVSNETIRDTLSAFPTLRAEQTESVRYLTTDSAAIACVNGIAGSGKSFMLGAARTAWEKSGYRVLGTALSATAAKELEKGSKIESTHIHRLLWKLDKGKQSLDANSILVVDEAGMVGTRSMEKIMRLAHNAQAKLVLVGDYRQLQAIEAGSAFKGILKRVGGVELREVIRQRDAWARKTVPELAEGRALSALEAFAKRGLLDIAPDRDQAMDRLVRDWWPVASKDLSETLILSGTNYEAETLNRLCQLVRLGGQNANDESVEVGDEAYFVGDRIRFTKNNAALLVQNGAMGTIESIDDATIRVRLDDGLGILIDTNCFTEFSLGYSVTSHVAQGKTVENVFVLTGGSMTDREISYVQGSRARGTTKLYADVLSGGDDIEALANQMSRSREKDLAIDYLREPV